MPVDGPCGHRLCQSSVQHGATQISTEMRLALVQKMPKKVPKSAKKRLDLAWEALNATGDDAICARRRFPAELVVQYDAEGQEEYVELDNIREQKFQLDAGGPWHEDDLGRPIEKELPLSNVEKSNFHYSEIKLICDEIVHEVAELIAEKIKNYTGNRIFGAITSRWLCVREIGICEERKVPKAAEDEDDEDEDIQDFESWKSAEKRKQTPRYNDELESAGAEL
eukprot:gnl/TRDRNA2_/TRDRNA2_133000_c0_seq4.p2 gnl/TRDRNA2_/TRDRNA2_133000_c0~~gnl/TRDRNA2_/TRDRNA2_133000_c0_seq4.p2  ORF type:complete len:224 (+),score=49.43 gnl/TRDRNA2_/TRDRNA2_133000_c0_seq4:166-837(+)